MDLFAFGLYEPMVDGCVFLFAGLNLHLLAVFGSSRVLKIRSLDAGYCTGHRVRLSGGAEQGYGSPEDDLGVPTLKSVLALELKFLVDPLSLLLLARNLAVVAPDVNRRSSSYVCDDAELRFL
ncbi:hypothetical protein Nepgr_015848 [Nepenthes gracilis]|uniref:Uncharacterized protein n=1 Tax=Nepenthes gracilis TaxID=150966 RepID=A0AAD3XQQ7_NEPGR|nr:hypothetical protein Nepgr_015848 [Nepenthes gracilis]